MNSERSKLIQELMRVGRLIDPATKKYKQKTKAELKDKVEHNDKENEPNEEIPVLDNIVDPPYSTLDMFGAHVESEIPIKTSQLNTVKIIEAIESENDVEKNEENDSFFDNSHLKSAGELKELPIDELAREIVVVIEGIVSKRSGESLDDLFRDDLLDAVTLQLKSWLHHD
tara:strand:- start:53 stop:565 length:513 start_codon:yes stop_codon:yes gene_type:complete